MKELFDIDELKKHSFESLERKIYEYICEIGKNITVELLEQLDLYLMKNRDKKRYVSKDRRKTTIKTVYGEVEYYRRMYYDTCSGTPVYLLDEDMQMEKIGTISVNLAKKIADATINMPYRKAADTISETTGLSISSHGVWNVTQQIGKVIQAEEEILVHEMKTEQTRGEKESKIIFMEADGVYLNIQKNKKKAKSQELKVSTVYSGWNNDGKSLYEKKVMAGMEPAKIFNQKTEALIQSVYNIDEAELRVLNGDGAGWIKNTTESDRIYQLDRFHIKKEIRRCIPENNIRKIIINKFENSDIDGMLEDIVKYINSIDDGTNSKKLDRANNLYRYLFNNYEGLLPWQKQVETIPEPPEGITYKNMGIQENQNCSLVCERLKGRKMRWSVPGANNMAKLIYMRENGDLESIIEKKDGYILLPQEININNVVKTVRQKKVGKGNKWIETIMASMPITNSANSPYVKLFRNIQNV